ncbi:STAS domain-containing protein [Sphaerisporangium album]|nr:STAS domain-containing protein [Sphaerisporangium album]
MTPFSIKLVHEQDRIRLILHGELDRGTVSRLDDAVEEALSGGCRHLTVDVAGLSFCDSSGLWALLRARRAVAAVQGSMELTNVQGVLRRLLDLTRLGEAFTIDPGPAASGDA